VEANATALVDLDRHAVAQVEQVAGDHLTAGIQALNHGISIVLQTTELHRRLQGEAGTGRQSLQLLDRHLARLQFQFSQGADPEDEALTRRLGDSREGHGGQLTPIQLDGGPQPLTVAQAAARIGERRLDQQGLGTRQHVGVDRVDPALHQHPIRAGLLEGHRQTGADSIGKDRRDIDAGEETIIANQAGEGISGTDHIAHLHLNVCHRAVDRRAQISERQIGPLGQHGLARLDVLSTELIALDCTGSTLTYQVFVTLVIEFVLFLPRQQGGQVSLELNLIEHQQQLAGLDLVALANAELLDPAAGLGGQLNLINGLKGADRLHPLAEGSDLNRSGAHHQGLGRWRRGLVTGRQEQCAQGNGHGGGLRGRGVEPA
jgi:hypothetical protein